MLEEIDDRLIIHLMKTGLFMLHLLLLVCERYFFFLTMNGWNTLHKDTGNALFIHRKVFKYVDHFLWLKIFFITSLFLNFSSFDSK